MRTIVDLPDEQLRPLAEYCQEEGLSRAEAIRRAVAGLLANHQSQQKTEAFGLWKGSGQDGVAYQRALRAEWDS